MADRSSKTAAKSDFSADCARLQQELWRAAMPWEQAQLRLSRTVIDNGLRAQSEWIRFCLRSASAGNGAFRDQPRWTESMDQLVERWTDLRREAWGTWFRVLENQTAARGEGSGSPDVESLFRAWQEANRTLVESWTNTLTTTTGGTEEAAESSRSEQANRVA